MLKDSILTGDIEGPALRASQATFPLDCTLYPDFIGRDIQTRYIIEIISKLKENYNFTDVSLRGGPNISNFNDYSPRTPTSWCAGY
jgi:hypothetical protein